MPRRALALALLLPLACAAGADGNGTTSTTGGGVPWTTSSGASDQGGTASQGGAPGSGGDGGALSNGGAPASGGAGGEGGDGGAPSTTSSGGGGSGSGGAPPLDGQAVFVALSSTTVTAGSFTEGGGWSVESSAAGGSQRPAVAMRGQDDALALFRDDGALAYVTLDGAGWSSPANVGAAITTRATPALAAGSTSFAAVFHGDDFKHYFAAYASSFNPSAEAVGNPQSFGPNPASIALLGTTSVLTFVGDDGNLYDQSRVGGVWQAASGHGLSGLDDTPAIVALDAGADLLVVFNRTSTAVSFTTRSGAVWSTPADIPSALTQDPVSLAPLSGGRAALAFRGTNGKVYAAIYDPGGGQPWSSPVAIDAPAGDTPSTPAVAPGVGGAEAELVYVTTGSGDVRHSRLQGSTWSASVSAGGSGLTSVAAASAP